MSFNHLKISNYRVGRTLGEGAYGKVKCKSCRGISTTLNMIKFAHQHLFCLI